MKRWMIFLATIFGFGLLLRLPQPGTDVAKLEPVEVVLVRQLQNEVRVETDTGASGCGEDLDSAVENLKAHAIGEVFLDTADYLLLDLENMGYTQLYPLFRPGCKVCIVKGIEDLEQVRAFLHTHKPTNSLLQIRAEERKLERLVQTKGALELVRSGNE